jgi:hypothetical protein
MPATPHKSSRHKHVLEHPHSRSPVVLPPWPILINQDRRPLHAPATPRPLHETPAPPRIVHRPGPARLHIPVGIVGLGTPRRLEIFGGDALALNDNVVVMPVAVLVPSAAQAALAHARPGFLLHGDELDAGRPLGGWRRRMHYRWAMHDRR